MIAVIEKSELNGNISVPASKSVAHRLLIAAALCESRTVLKSNFVGDDTEATINCLSALGAKFERAKQSIIVEPIKKTGVNESLRVLNAGASGSTLRFLLPVVGALGLTASFTGIKRLAERPIEGLLAVMKKHGITTDSETLPFTVSGKLTGGNYEIEADVSSQYITGLLLALPLLKEDSRIILKGRKVSFGYVNITIDVLRLCGALIEKTDYGFYVRGGGSYAFSGEICAESDWSSACFFIVGGTLCGKLNLLGLNSDSLQGDKVIVSVLKNAGADIGFQNGVLKVDKARLNALQFNAENCPDIVPALAVALACASGESVISGIKRLRGKESDRVEETLKMLHAFGIKARAEEDKLFIQGGELHSAVLNLPDDHRIAMAAAIAATRAAGVSTLYGVECVSKSYPGFFGDLEKAGGKISVRSI